MDIVQHVLTGKLELAAEGQMVWTCPIVLGVPGDRQATARVASFLGLKGYTPRLLVGVNRPGS